MTREKRLLLQSPNNVPKYIGVQPYVVHEKQLKRAWKDIFFEALPEELGEKQMGQ